MPGVKISTSTVDRLLDAHSYSAKLAAQRPADRNRDDVKHSRKLYAQWLQSDGPRVCRFYLDETTTISGVPGILAGQLKGNQLSTRPRRQKERT
ncbi:hypothetical protein HPB52_015191 [Rhipicephalus sanguineus]|uniref:Uncharacterized protein n=1 Tax=Rhipicephalus sanguineus TaxID=34632 RepID=A0A9D4Q0K2_RHISA|nr:hypothetical protein HPB52_015191 [Rhipicephalus sanguineus]